MQINGIQTNKIRPNFGTTEHKKQSWKDRTQEYIKKEPEKAAAIGGGSLLLLAVAIYKRKAITKLLKSLFQKEEKNIAPTPNPTSAPKLPEPHFTVGKENPTKLAEEQAAYIKSIEKEYIDIDPRENKEKSLMGLKALQKYGSREDLKILDKNSYCISKDDDIMREYAKFVGKVGETKDIITLIAKINKETIGMYAEKTLEEIMKTTRTVMEEKAPVGHYKNFGFAKYKQYELYAEQYKENRVINDNAQAIMRRIEADNPAYNPKTTPNPASAPKLPEPHFTVGKENPTQLAKEQAAYIKSIEKEYIDIDPRENKEKSLMGLKALQKYGSREDLKILDKNSYCISKDDDIMREYAKFVGKVGETKDIITLIAKINKETIGMYAEKTLEEIMKTTRTVMEEKAPVGHYKNFGFAKYKQYELYAEQYKENRVINENAQAIMRRIEADNPAYKS